MGIVNNRVKKRKRKSVRIVRLSDATATDMIDEGLYSQLYISKINYELVRRTGQKADINQCFERDSPNLA